MPLSRGQFVASAAALTALTVTASADAADEPDSGRAPVHFHLLPSSQYDYAGMMRAIETSQTNKQLFQASAATVAAPGIASLFLHMQNSMNAFQFSLPKPQHLATIGVLMSPSMIFALNDAMWEKYKLGAAFNLPPGNVYYKAGSNLDLSAKPDDPNGIYQDWSAQAVLKRGGKFFVCHNATTAVAAMTAMKSGNDPAAVLADFEKNLLPGFSFVAAGVATVQLAAERGWHLFQV